MEKNKSQLPCKMITPEFRSSYMHIFKPSGMPGTSPETWKFQITMLFDKAEPMEGKVAQPDGKLGAPITLQKLALNAKINKWGADKAQWPKSIANPFAEVDGDSDKYEGKEGYAGHWVVKATSIQTAPPSIVDLSMSPITNPNEFPSGSMARAQIFANVYEFPKGSKKFGVQFILDGVQKTKGGQPFGGKGVLAFDPIQADEAESSEVGFGNEDGDTGFM